jgi:hypothetical protein
MTKERLKTYSVVLSEPAHRLLAIEATSRRAARYIAEDLLCQWSPEEVDAASVRCEKVFGVAPERYFGVDMVYESGMLPSFVQPDTKDCQLWTVDDVAVEPETEEGADFS